MRTKITTAELREWHTLRQQLVNGYHMSKFDTDNLIRLNFLVLEAVQEIHNDEMLRKDN